jgi:hypothetical protein
MLLQNLRRLVRPDRYEAQINLSNRRTWFADEPPAQPAADDKKPQAPAPTGDKPTPEQPAADKDAPPDWVKDPAKAYEEIRKLRDENAGHRKTANEAKAQADKLTAEKAKQDEAKLAAEKNFEELAKKAQQERDKALADLEKANLESLRIRVGIDFKLTSGQIKRLQGSTEDELRKDAAEMVKEFGLDKQPEQPATPQKKGGTQTTAVAPGGPPAGETDAERRARLYKQGPQATPLFSKTDNK